MAAGLPAHLIKARIRRRLQKFAREHGGVYKAFAATGRTPDGIHWTHEIGVTSASNGEQFAAPRFRLWEPAGPGQKGAFAAYKSFAGSDLAGAVLAYKVETGRADDPGEAGDYRRLIGHRNPWCQTWGLRFAIGFNLDDGGFDLFSKAGGSQAFRGEDADRFARSLFALVGKLKAADKFRPGYEKTPPTRAERLEAAEALDAWVERVTAGRPWSPSTDWRTKPDSYVSDFNLPRA